MDVVDEPLRELRDNIAEESKLLLSSTRGGVRDSGHHVVGEFWVRYDDEWSGWGEVPDSRFTRRDEHRDKYVLDRPIVTRHTLDLLRVSDYEQSSARYHCRRIEVLQGKIAFDSGS